MLRRGRRHTRGPRGTRGASKKAAFASKCPKIRDHNRSGVGACGCRAPCGERRDAGCQGSLRRRQRPRVRRCVAKRRPTVEVDSAISVEGVVGGPLSPRIARRKRRSKPLASCRPRRSAMASERQSVHCPRAAPKRAAGARARPPHRRGGCGIAGGGLVLGRGRLRRRSVSLARGICRLVVTCCLFD